MGVHVWLRPSHDPTALACDRQRRRVHLAERLPTATPMPPRSALLTLPPTQHLLLWQQGRVPHRPLRGCRSRSSTGCSTSSCSATVSCRPATTGGARRNASQSRPSPLPPLVRRCSSCFFPCIRSHPKCPAGSSFTPSISYLTGACVCADQANNRLKAAVNL